MNIIFTKLPTTDGIIKISLDGGQSFTDYNIANIPEDGISLNDDQDFEKIRIKGPANVLKNLDVISSVKVEGESGSSGGSVKLYAWNNPDSSFSYQRVYTYSENPQVNDVVISGAKGDMETEINIGKITSIEDGAFRVDSSLGGDDYNTRCPDDDIELTVNSDVDLSDYVRKEYIHCELCEGSCSDHYRISITDWPDTLDYGFLPLLYLSEGESLGNLCNSQYYNMLKKPTGQLYLRVYNYGSCPGSYRMLPTQYYLV